MRAVSSPSVRAPSGHFSPGLLVDPGKHWLVLSGQVAIDVHGNIPVGIEAQTRLVWDSIKHLLAAAGMKVSDVVKVTSYVTSADHLPGFNAARAGVLGDHKPASTLLIVSGLSRPEYLVEVEVTAAL